VASAAGAKLLARTEYERAVQLDPTDSAAWNNLGCLDLAAGRPLRARARFREALRLDPRGERARRNLALVAREGRPVREWSDVLVRLMDEVARGGTRNALALALEAPETATALVRGGGTGAAVAGALVVALLRMMGGAALLPLGAGAAMAGAAWLRYRNELPSARARVRAALTAGRVEFDRLWQDWLAGRATRELRDREMALVIEKMALEIVEHE
jgi:tetratricopeptide (TPR) repeat protein